MYKYCIVPKCTNTTIKTPEKLFLNVPKDPKLRKKWYSVVKRDDKTTPSAQATRHCCEDHFDLEEDMENYVKFKLVGGKLKLKKGVLPHKFECQKFQKNKTDRPGSKKRKVLRKDIGHEDLLLHSTEVVECENQDSNSIQNSDPIYTPEEIDVELPSVKEEISLDDNEDSVDSVAGQVAARGAAVVQLGARAFGGPGTLTQATEATAAVRRRKSLTETWDSGETAEDPLASPKEAMNNQDIQEEDECDLHGKIFAKKLRKLPESERTQFMCEVYNKFLHYEQRYAASSSSSKI